MKKIYSLKSIVAASFFYLLVAGEVFAQSTTITPAAEAAVGTWQVVRGSQRLQGAQYMKGNYPNQPVVKWQATLTTTNGGCEGDPVIGDLDGDGKNDVAVTTGNGYLMTFNGTTGAPMWQKTGYSGQVSAVIGDANGDGKIDIASVMDKIYLLDGATGNLIWSFTPTLYSSTRIESCPNMADLDHDGKVEVVVVVQDAIYAIDGATGLQKWKYATGLPLKNYNGTAPAIADVNGDGILDIVAPLQKSTNSPSNTQGGVLVAVDGATGTLIWSDLINGTGAYGISAHFPAIGDVDGDCQLDVVFNTAAVKGIDGSAIWGTVSSNGARFSVIADLNEDCNVQVVTGCGVLNAKTGATIWQKTSCSQYGWFAPAPRVGDFDPASPGKELILAAAYQTNTSGVPVANPMPIQMYAGYTGTLLWSYDIATLLGHTVEGMAIGDIDNDGCVEIVVAPDCCNGANTLLALDDAGNTGSCGILASIGQVDFVADSVSCNSRNFKDFSSNCANSWNWTFTGGIPDTSTAKNPGVITYNASGTYTVMMTAKLNACSKTDTVLRTIIINSCSALPHAVFTSSDTAFCDEAGKCIDFYDHSIGSPSSWQWIFTGATPSTSSAQNPTGICYYYPGTYPVSLVVYNGVGYDTLDVPLINFGLAPPPPVVTAKGDTVFSSHGSSYQWYLNGSPIPGAIDSFYVATQSGTYAVQTTDNIGCISLSSGVYVTVTFMNEEAIRNGIKIYPSPVKDILTISGLNGRNKITLSNVLGEIVYASEKNISAGENLSITTALLPSGVYIISFNSSLGVINEKIIVQK